MLDGGKTCTDAGNDRWEHLPVEGGDAAGFAGAVAMLPRMFCLGVMLGLGAAGVSVGAVDTLPAMEPHANLVVVTGLRDILLSTSIYVPCAAGE
jgi:hypothetical protein